MATHLTTQELRQGSAGFLLRLDFELKGFTDSYLGQTWRVKIVCPDGRVLSKTTGIEVLEDEPKISVPIADFDLIQAGRYWYQVTLITGGANVNSSVETFEIEASLPDGVEYSVISSSFNYFPIFTSGGGLAQSTLRVDEDTDLNYSGGGAKFAGAVKIPDEAYGVSWNGKLEAATKNAIYDKVNSLSKADIGLSNVDNTSDAQKPVSIAQQAALDAKANLSGATFTGYITVPNHAFGTDWSANNTVPTKAAIYSHLVTGDVSATTLRAYDWRGGIVPTNVSGQRVATAFATYNNGTGTYADAIIFTTWIDPSGGNQNQVLFNKNNFGMRIFQGSQSSSTVPTDYRDVVLTENNPTIGYVPAFNRVSGGVTVANSSIYNVSAGNVRVQFNGGNYFSTFVDSSGNTTLSAVGTTPTIAVSNPLWVNNLLYIPTGQRAQFGATPADSGAYSLTNWGGTGAVIPLAVKSATNNGGTTPSSPQPALVLMREGISAQAYANFAEFKLSRWENNGVKARTRMDIALTHGDGDSTATTVMALRSDGRVGIGTLSPMAPLDVRGTAVFYRGLDAIAYTIPDCSVYVSSASGGSGGLAIGNVNNSTSDLIRFLDAAGNVMSKFDAYARFYHGTTSATDGMFNVRLGESVVGINLQAPNNSNPDYLKIFSSGGTLVFSITGGFAPTLSFNDVGIARGAAGVLKITNGSTGYGSIEVADEAYGAGWNGSLQVPTKNAIYDYLATFSSGISVGSAITGGTNNTVLYKDASGNLASNAALAWTGALFRISAASAKFVLHDTAVTETNRVALTINASNASPSRYEFSTTDSDGTYGTRTSYMSFESGSTSFGANANVKITPYDSGTASRLTFNSNNAAILENVGTAPFILVAPNFDFRAGANSYFYGSGTTQRWGIGHPAPTSPDALLDLRPSYNEQGLQIKYTSTPSVEGLSLVNSEVSTAGATVKHSPSLEFIGHGWNPTGTPADNAVNLRIISRTVSPVDAAPYPTFVIQQKTAGYWQDAFGLSANGMSAALSLRHPTVSGWGIKIEGTYDGIATFKMLDTDTLSGLQPGYISWPGSSGIGYRSIRRWGTYGTIIQGAYGEGLYVKQSEEGFGTTNTYIEPTLGVGMNFVGVTSPQAQLHIKSTTEQLRVGYNDASYYKTEVASDGETTLTSVGSTPAFEFKNGTTFTVITAQKQWGVRIVPDFASNYYGETRHDALFIDGNTGGFSSYGLYTNPVKNLFRVLSSANSDVFLIDYVGTIRSQMSTYYATDGSSQYTIAIDGTNQNYANTLVTALRVTGVNIATHGVEGTGQVRLLRIDDETNNIFTVWRNNNSYFETGNVGIGIAGNGTLSARLHIAAGTATAGTAPIKLTSGTALATPEDGAIEYHSSHLYFTIGSTRYQLDQQGDSPSWGAITGTLSNQTDLQNALNAKEPTITAGTTAQYWRGDKSWQTLDKAAVGLSNVENTALSTWGGSSNITTLGTVTTGKVKYIGWTDMRSGVVPNSIPYETMSLAFGTFDNNNTGNYSDTIILNGYTDNSGGFQNMIVVNKNAFGLRIFRADPTVATASTSFRDVPLLNLTSLADDHIIQRKAGEWVNRTVAQFKTDLALTKADVGLANVTNDAQLKIASNLSDLNNAATARTNLGLGNVPNVDATNASNLTSGTVPVARLGASGTRDATTYLRGDNTWATISASVAWGGITGTLSSQTDLNNALAAKAPIASPTFTTSSTTSFTNGTITLQEISSAPFIVLNNTAAGGVLGSGIRFQKNATTQFGFGIDYAGNGTRNWWVYDYVRNGLAFILDSSGNLGLGTDTMSARLHLISTTEQLRAGYNTSNYTTLTVASNGVTTFNAVGTAPAFSFTGGTFTAQQIITSGSNAGFINNDRTSGNPSTQWYSTAVGTLHLYNHGASTIMLTFDANDATFTQRIITYKTSEQLRIGYSASYYWTASTSNAGNTIISGNAGHTFHFDRGVQFNIGSGSSWLPYTDGNIYLSSANIIFRNASNTEIGRLDSSGLNLRPKARVTSTTSSSTPTPNADNEELFILTALAANATFGAVGGTPTNGQKLMIRIKDNGTARTLAWNAVYRAVGVALPTTTTVNKTMYVGFIYNSTDSKWDCVSVAVEA